MKRVAVLITGTSLIVFAGCMGKPTEQVPSETEITPPTENKDIESFFDYLEETIKKEEDADAQAAIEAAQATGEVPTIIEDPNFDATSGSIATE